MTAGFCESLPGQPRIWDPTRLAILDTCPRKHLLATIRGLRRNGQPSVHLQWGKAYHAAVEVYDRALLDGYTPKIAEGVALDSAEIAMEEQVWGETIETWRCTDPEMVEAKRIKVWRHRETGEICDAPASDPKPGALWELVPKMIQNRDRCKFAKGWQPQPEPDYPHSKCECGRGVEWGSIFVPYDPKKTGETLVAAVQAYCESATSLKPYQFPSEDIALEQARELAAYDNPLPERFYIDAAGEVQEKRPARPGVKALELQARLPLPIKSPDDEPLTGVDGELGWRRNQPYELLVNIDSLVSWEEDIAIRERKTTGLQIESPKVAWKYWAQFAPNIQIETYDLVGSVLYRDEDGQPPKIMVEALSIADPGAPYIERKVIHRTEAQRAETFREIQSLILDAEKRAVDVAAGIDPEVAFEKRRSACVQGFRICPFYDVCTASPGDREAIIQANYHEERWSPEDAKSFIPEGESNDV